MTTPALKPHPDDLFLITREELDRCCSQMSAAGYKISANYIEALVLSHPHTSAPAPALFQIEPNSHDYTIGQIVEINENIQKQRKEAAKAAREHCHRMCNERIGNVRVTIMDNRKNMSQDCYESIMNSIDNVTYRIQSLRHQQEANQPKEHQ